jgi:DNA-binding NarL/FixJ family response regulator
VRVAETPTQVRKPIRVVVGQAARLLRDIVAQAIARQPDMELISATSGELDAVRCGDADVAIVEDVSDAHGVPAPLIANPDLKVIVVTDNGRSAHVVALSRWPVGEVSPQGLVDAIRAAVNRAPRHERG